MFDWFMARYFEAIELFAPNEEIKCGLASKCDRPHFILLLIMSSTMKVIRSVNNSSHLLTLDQRFTQLPNRQSIIISTQSNPNYNSNNQIKTKRIIQTVNEKSNPNNSNQSTILSSSTTPTKRNLTVRSKKELDEAKTSTGSNNKSAKIVLKRKNGELSSNDNEFTVGSRVVSLKSNKSFTSTTQSSPRPIKLSRNSSDSTVRPSITLNRNK
jgi:hypothetical protein